MTSSAQARLLQFPRTEEDETTISDKVANITLPIRLTPGTAHTFSITYGTSEGGATTEASQFQVFTYPLPSSGFQEKEVSGLRDRVKTLEDRLEAIEKEQEPKVILLRAISREDAKAEVLRLFEESQAEILDYGIIAERLQMDLQIVVDVCNELEREGLIG